MTKTCIHKGQKHHLISSGTNGLYLSYENVLKNSKKPNPFGTFIVKLFDETGTDLVQYWETDKSIFRDPRLVELTKEFNPELLI